MHQNEVTPDAAQSLHGLARLRFAGSTAARDGQTRMLIHLHAVTMLRRTLASMHPVGGMERLTAQLAKHKSNAELVSLISGRAA